MSDTMKFENLQDRIIELRGQSVLLDADVAEIYGVETKRINEAVKNNPDKFPAGYIIELDKTEWDGLKSKFSTSTKGGKVKLPSAFPEKGLYMLATILKSPDHGGTDLKSVPQALFNQDDLIALRTEKGVHRLIPGITGWLLWTPRIRPNFCGIVWVKPPSIWLLPPAI